MMTEKTDAELVALTKAGDDEAFGLLIRRYQATAHALALRLVRHSAIAQELVQEALLQAYLSLTHLRDSARFKGWLCGIVANECRNYHRNLKPFTCSLDALVSTPSDEGLIGAQLVLDPQDIVEQHEAQQEVLAALGKLSARNRQAALLFYYQQLSLQEIATSLGISLVAVKSRLHKGRNELRDLLGAAGMGSGRHASVSPLTGKEQSMIKLHIVKVVVHEPISFSMILLFDEGRHKALPVWLDGRAGEEIKAGFYKETIRGIFTFGFVAELLQVIGGNLVEVRLEQVAEMSYGVVVVRRGKKTQELKARVSDVLALAAHTDCPIYATAQVMQEAIEIPVPADGHTLSVEQKVASLIGELDRQGARKMREKQPETPYNLHFEEGLTGWTATGSHPQEYTWGIDPAEQYHGASCLSLQSTVEDPHGFGGVLQWFHSSRYKGKRVRFSASVKAEQVADWAGLAMSVEGLQGTLLYADTRDSAIRGTQEWQQVSLVVDVVEASVHIMVGLLLYGTGSVWMSNVQVEEVGQEVAPTRVSRVSRTHVVNLNFEHGKEGWYKAGDRPQDYRFEIDPNVKRSGTASGTLQFTGTDPSGFGTFAQVLLAEDYRDKHIRLSGFVKAESVEPWAGLWMRVDRGAGVTQSFDNMQDRAITGTCEWTRCEITLPVYGDSQYIYFGLLLGGTGQVWLDDLHFEVVEQEHIKGTHSPDGGSMPLGLSLECL